MTKTSRGCRRLFALRSSLRGFARPLFLGLVLTTGAASGCRDGNNVGANGADSDGALLGELQTFVIDNEDGSSTREHFLVLSDPGQTRLKLEFDGIAPPSGTDSIRAWGSRQGDTLRVSAFERTDLVGEGVPGNLAIAGSGLTGVTPRPRRAVFVIVDVGGGTKLTNASAASTVFAPGKNFADVYNQISYGILPMSGDVVGPLSFPNTTCDYNGTARALRPMIPTPAAGAYNHYMWYFATNPGCTWSGLGAEGSVSRAQSDSWYNASTGCTVLVQEVGHNLGWMHSSTLRCAAGTSFADDPLSCTSSEYGNRYTPMGSGCGHFAAYDKWYGGLISGCNGATVTASGTFNLMPLENACNGLQAIQIPMLKTTRTARPQQGTAQPLKHYYLEYRGPWGLDTAVRTPQVMVYAGDDIHAPTRTSNWTWLLDMAPATANTFEGLLAGQTFTDPAGGITINVVSTDATRAVVQITITGGAGAAPTCIDGSTLVSGGPVDCGAGAGGAGPVATAGTGGAGGARGSGGSTGAGTGGGTVRGATGGAGVSAGTGGEAAGSGGATSVGLPGSGSGGAPGNGISSGDASGVVGGCACDVAAPSSGPLAPAIFLAGLVVLARRRRLARRPD